MSDETNKKIEKEEDLLLDSHIEFAEILGFWGEGYISSLKRILESRYKSEVVKRWCISDVVINGDKYLIKWTKRFMPLTDEEYEDQYLPKPKNEGE
jgi:hypothetical protein